MRGPQATGLRMTGGLPMLRKVHHVIPLTCVAAGISTPSLPGSTGASWCMGRSRRWMRLPSAMKASTEEVEEGSTWGEEGVRCDSPSLPLQAACLAGWGGVG